MPKSSTNTTLDETWSLIPGSLLEKTAESAASMATTLWFDENEMQSGKLTDLISCGQFNACYNIYEYIVKLENACLLAATDEEKNHIAQIDWSVLAEIKQQLTVDWIQFKKNPAWLHQVFLPDHSTLPNHVS